MTRRAVTAETIRRRRWIAGLTSVATLALLAFAFGHRGTHMLRSVLVPGAGLYERSTILGIVFTVGAIGAAIAWLRWGADWIFAVVCAASIAASGLLANDAHVSLASDLARVRAAHEFPLVILVLGFLSWLRIGVRRIPVVAAFRSRRAVDVNATSLDALPVVDRCRTAVLLRLVDATSSEGDIVDALRAPDVTRRARRVGFVARGRFRDDPLERDQSSTRAALMTWRLLDERSSDNFALEASDAWAGVPCSEPGWVRLLDGTLSALVLAERDPTLSQRWAQLMNGELRLHRGRRPAWVWTPLAIASGRPEDWEHATASALAYRAGWIPADDWTSLRKRALAASARGPVHPSDERMIAAGRLWAALVRDETAARLLDRPTVSRDPLAVAVAALAAQQRSLSVK